MRTVIRAALQSILHLTRMHTPTFEAAKLQYLSWPSGARIGSSYEDYSVLKDTEEKLIEVR